MGSETRNRVRGYGHGVIPDMVSYASSSGSRSSRSSSKGAFAKVVAENNELRRRGKKPPKSWQRQRLSLRKQRPRSSRHSSSSRQ
ncbi:hypothetical protein DVH24_016827 [Malus domestica]|uniref:Uncharacterized protein n=1 Tax=Malus domestica TaxID=3750 RepID=A0A498HWQ1_MALDO|nr:hypothetical protein DVH24_016827 [Malus domestica]